MSVKTDDASLLLICATISLLFPVVYHYYRRSIKQRFASADVKGHRITEDSEFKYPKIEPRTEDLEHIKPIPYRPFRWGDYQYVLGLIADDMD
jgi:hypothetical protein